MTTRPAQPSYGQTMVGAAPADWANSAAVDGDRPPWSDIGIGSTYWKRVSANQQELYIKVKQSGTYGQRNDDWVLLLGTFSQRVGYASFTDGGGTTGTLALNVVIPAGAYYINTLVTDLDDFTGSAVVTFTVGDGTTVDRYNTGTPSAAANADYLDVGVPSGTLLHTAAKTVTVTVTADDFGNVTAGAMTISGFYRGALLG